MKTFYVYILANRRYGTLYVGVTNDILRRMTEHKDGRCGSFPNKYKLNKLVWYEGFERIDDAIAFEKN